MMKHLSASDIDEACELMLRSNVVAVPTETVYGLAAVATDSDAVDKIFKAKHRPADNPLIVHISSVGQLEDLCFPTETAYMLAERFWPGPLTMILPKKDCIPDNVSAGLDTVAVRMPSNPIAHEIILRTGPFAAPSANLSGKPSATEFSHVVRDFDDSEFVAAGIDGGKCINGLESTVVSLIGVPTLLRPGFVTAEQLREVIPNLQIAHAVLEQMKNGEKPLSPGMAHRHYAPEAKTIAVSGSLFSVASYIAEHRTEKTTFICRDDEEPISFCSTITIGTTSEDAGRNLFAALREADETDTDLIYVRIPDTEGVGLAVRNRLLRAASFNIADCDKESAKFILGITGQSGAGKNYVCGIFEKYGFLHIDTDRLAAEVREKKADILNEAFPGILINGVIDKKELAKQAFSSQKKTDLLNRIMHGAIMDEVRSIISASESKLFIVNGAALFEAGTELYDYVIAVTADERSRLERIKKRDGISETEALLRFSAQKPEEYYTRADFVIRNNLNEDPRPEVIHVLRDIIDKERHKHEQSDIHSKKCI